MLISTYRDLVLDHACFNRVLTEVERSLAPGMPPQIVMLLGPTGVGKTSVIESVKRRCVASGARVAHATCLPVRDGRGYTFGRTHWKLITEALDDPFSDEHASPDAVGHRLRSGARRDGAASADEYRLGVLASLRERGLRAVVLDEAQHMVRVPSARSQADQLDVIKDCVDRTQISHLLSGTYELAVMVAPSEQLARRSWVVHFPPYGASEDSDQLAFQKIFGQLVVALPLEEPKRSWEELRNHLVDVYVGSAGCVGILKDWLVKALQLALATKKEFVDWPLMDQCRLPDSDLFKIADEIRAYRDVEKKTRADIEKVLGVTRAVSGGGTKRRSSSRKPGKRSPARDPVGLPRTAAASSE